MLRNYLLPMIIVLLCALPVEAAGPLETAGRVEFVTGDAWFIDASRQIHRALRGDRLRATDTIITANDGEVHLNMEDGGYLAVRPNSLLKVEEYRAHGDKDDSVILNLLKGTFRSFTGWIPKITPNGYQTKTITATIGVRGTDHEPLFIAEGSDVGEAGTYDKVNEGATFIDHASGRIEVLPNTAGFAPLAADAKARLLERVPDFFRPSANENLLAGRHKLVQDRLQERLDARRRLSKSPTGEGEPTEPPSEMQEAPTSPEGTRGIQDAPASSTLPGVEPASAVVPSSTAAPASVVVPSAAAVPASAVVRSITAAPASAAVPSAAATPASAVVRSITAAPASAAAPSATAAPASAAVPSAKATPAAAVVPSIPAASPSAVVPGKNEAPPPAVAPNTSGRPRSAAGRPRGVPDRNQSTDERARPIGVLPDANEREKLVNERRKKQQEDHQDQYERDRELERERDSERARDADRAAAKRSKEQR